MQRTKTTHIINEALSPKLNNDGVKLCKENKFSIMMDEANDKGNDKCVAILVRVLDESVRKTETKFLAMTVCNIVTGANVNVDLVMCKTRVLRETKIRSF